MHVLIIKIVYQLVGYGWENKNINNADWKISPEISQDSWVKTSDIERNTATQQANDIDYDIKPAVNEWNGKQNGNCKYQMKRNKKMVLTGNCCTNHANGYGHYVTANSVRFAEYSYQYVFN